MTNEQMKQLIKYQIDCLELNRIKFLSVDSAAGRHQADPYMSTQTKILLDIQSALTILVNHLLK